MPLDPVFVTSYLQNILDEESAKNHIPYIPVKHRSYRCSVEKCLCFAYAKGLCNTHYLRKKQGKDLSRPLRCRKKTDNCVECGKLTNHKGGWYRCTRCFKNYRRKVLKTALVALFGGRCERCGLAFPICVYDFHHIQNKVFGIGNIFEIASIKTLASEIVKCVLMCANCHRLETYGEF